MLNSEVLGKIVHFSDSFNSNMVSVVFTFDIKEFKFLVYIT